MLLSLSAPTTTPLLRVYEKAQFYCQGIFNGPKRYYTMPALYTPIAAFARGIYSTRMILMATAWTETMSKANHTWEVISRSPVNQC
jgi:hypothetical protein